MADEIEALRREIERKSLELESLKNLFALKVSSLKKDTIMKFFVNFVVILQYNLILSVSFIKIYLL